MAENLLTYILIGVIGILGWMVVDEKYINPVEERRTTDTVFVDKPYMIEPVEPKDQIIPATITLWETEYKDLEKIELVDDTVEVYVDSSGADPILYNTRFLTNYTNSPKFLNLDLTSEYVEFTGMRPNGETQSTRWPLDLAQNDYRMAPGGNGFVQLEAEPTGGLFGLDFAFSHSMGVGTRWVVEQQGLQQDFYFKYNPKLQFRRNISLESQVWITPRPFGTVGLEYEF